MLFWILGDILVELGCQEGPEIAEKIYENLDSFSNEICMDFGSPGAAFEAACLRDPKGGTSVLASRAISNLLIWLYRFIGSLVHWFIGSSVHWFIASSVHFAVSV